MSRSEEGAVERERGVHKIGDDVAPSIHRKLKELVGWVEERIHDSPEQEGVVGGWGHPFEVDAPDGSGVPVWSCCGVQTDEGHANGCRFADPDPPTQGEDRPEATSDLTISERERRIFERIAEERRRQDGKWGTEFPDRDWDRWVTILVEEVGEFAEAVLEMPYRGHVGESEIRKELVEVAAVAVSALVFGAPQGSQRGAGGGGIEELEGKTIDDYRKGADDE